MKMRMRIDDDGDDSEDRGNDADHGDDDDDDDDADDVDDDDNDDDFRAWKHAGLKHICPHQGCCSKKSLNKGCSASGQHCIGHAALLLKHSTAASSIS